MAAYPARVLALLVAQLGALLLPALLVGLPMHWLAGRVQAWTGRAGGRLAVLLLHGPGTVVHEAGHWLFCVVFRHRVTRVVWFDARAAEGRYGQVAHAWDRRSLWQRLGNFFIGVGPLLLGTLLLWGLARGIVGARASGPAHLSFDAVRAWGHTMLAALAHVRPGSWRPWALLYAALAVGGALRLSPEDLRGAARGLPFLLLALVLLDAALLGWLGGARLLHPFAVAGGALSGAMVLALAAQLVAAAISGPLALLRAR